MKLKWFNVLMVLMTLLGTFFTSTVSVKASSLSLNEMTSYSYTGHSPNVGYVMTHQIYVLKMDGKKVFCIQSGIPTSSGEGYIPEIYISSKKEKLS
ncbi:hypothetical protein [Vagococcus carniphilus]|nr:hypothetical protein [Vagococcus carniphilus]MDT2816148.1 hypothetical protein [Vagococcus carniphilus]MDT2865908.1 hypothetical protein [Vagococcus carniphilus]